MSPYDSQSDELPIDREIRIEKMKRELEELSGGSLISGGSGELPPSLEEEFLDLVLKFEKRSRTAISIA